jgi:hypothetical protein
MTLPKLERKPGVTEMWRSGSGFEDISLLLQELHEGVLELAEGQNKGKPPFKYPTPISVLAADGYDRTPPTLGYVLSIDTDAEEWRRWVFEIPVEAYRQSCEKLPPMIREAMTTTSGRVHLGILLQAGLSPKIIEERLSDPAVRFLRAKIERLKKEREAVPSPADLAKQFGMFRPDRVTRDLLLQHEITSIGQALHELELGEHLA